MVTSLGPVPKGSQMPKNNSKQRKEERVEKVKERELRMLVRDCGHWHTDNGWILCPYYKENQKIS